MIDFCILDPQRPGSTWLEFCRVVVKYDLNECLYAPEARRFTLEELERLKEQAFRIKDASGQAFTISVIGTSQKVRNAPEIMQKHIKAYFAHPLRYVVQKDIERRTG